MLRSKSYQVMLLHGFHASRHLCIGYSSLCFILGPENHLLSSPSPGFSSPLQLPAFKSVTWSQWNLLTGIANVFSLSNSKTLSSQANLKLYPSKRRISRSNYSIFPQDHTDPKQAIGGSVIIVHSSISAHSITNKSFFPVCITSANKPPLLKSSITISSIYIPSDLNVSIWTALRNAPTTFPFFLCFAGTSTLTV